MCTLSQFLHLSCSEVCTLESHKFLLSRQEELKCTKRTCLPSSMATHTFPRLHPNTGISVRAPHGNVHVHLVITHTTVEGRERQSLTNKFLTVRTAWGPATRHPQPAGTLWLNPRGASAAGSLTTHEIQLRKRAANIRPPSVLLVRSWGAA